MNSVMLILCAVGMAVGACGMWRCHQRGKRLAVAQALLDRADIARRKAEKAFFLNDRDGYEIHQREFDTLLEQVRAIGKEKW